MFKKSSLSLAAALTALVLVTMACGISIPGSTTITPSGVVISETRDVSGFDSVDVSTLGELTLIQGATESLVIEADDNLMPYVKPRSAAANSPSASRATPA